MTGRFSSSSTWVVATFSSGKKAINKMVRCRRIRKFGAFYSSFFVPSHICTATAFIIEISSLKTYCWMVTFAKLRIFHSHAATTKQKPSPNVSTVSPCAFQLSFIFHCTLTLLISFHFFRRQHPLVSGARSGNGLSFLRRTCGPVRRRGHCHGIVHTDSFVSRQERARATEHDVCVFGYTRRLWLERRRGIAEPLPHQYFPAKLHSIPISLSANQFAVAAQRKCSHHRSYSESVVVGSISTHHGQASLRAFLLCRVPG